MNLFIPVFDNVSNTEPTFAASDRPFFFGSLFFLLSLGLRQGAFNWALCIGATLCPAALSPSSPVSAVLARGEIPLLPWGARLGQRERGWLAPFGSLLTAQVTAVATCWWFRVRLVSLLRSSPKSSDRNSYRPEATLGKGKLYILTTNIRT